MNQLEELWKNEWKSQVFDHYDQKQKHLSEREKKSLRRARDLEKKRWVEFNKALEPIYTKLGNRLHDVVVITSGEPFYQFIEHLMVKFVNQAYIKCVVEPEMKDAAAAAAAEIARAAAGPVPPIPPKSIKRQRSTTSVQQHDLQKAQDALREMSLSGAAGGSAPAQPRPLPPIPVQAQAGSTSAPAPAAAVVAGPSSSSALDPDDDAALAGAMSIEHAFRPPSRGSSTDSSSDEDSESEDEKPLLHRDF